MKSVKFLILTALVIGVALVGTGVAARNIFTMSNTQEFGTIDPARGTDYTESYAMLNLYDALVMPSSTGEIEPKLAESWTISSDGLATRGVLIRHLVMPGALEETRAILTWIATELGPNTYVNLMDQYRPAGKVSASRYAEINRPVSPDEFRAAWEIAKGLGLRLDARRELIFLRRYR